MWYEEERNEGSGEALDKVRGVVEPSLGRLPRVLALGGVAAEAEDVLDAWIEGRRSGVRGAVSRGGEKATRCGSWEFHEELPPDALAALRASDTLSLEMLVHVRCIWVSRQNCCWKLELRKRRGKNCLSGRFNGEFAGRAMRSVPELEGQVRGRATRAPGDVDEEGLELPHPLHALVKVLDA